MDSDIISWILPVIVVAVLILYLLYEHWPRSPEALYDKRRAELYADMNRRGLTDEQKTCEIRFRYAIVRLRKRSSELVLKAPHRHAEIISTVAAEETKLLMKLDRSTARRFLDTVNTAHLQDILTWDALKAVDRLHKRKRVQKVTPLDIAAMTTIR